MKNFYKANFESLEKYGLENPKVYKIYEKDNIKKFRKGKAILFNSRYKNIMSKSKVHMPKELEEKCHIAIHSATAAATLAGAIPIPMSDAVPITAAQISMIVALGKIFDITLSQAAAKSIVSVGLAQQAGRTVASSILTALPGVGTIIGGVVGASTAAALTEALGWIVADDFYRMSQGKDPENIIENADGLKSAFDGLKLSK